MGEMQSQSHIQTQHTHIHKQACHRSPFPLDMFSSSSRPDVCVLPSLSEYDEISFASLAVCVCCYLPGVYVCVCVSAHKGFRTEQQAVCCRPSTLQPPPSPLPPSCSHVCLRTCVCARDTESTSDVLQMKPSVAAPPARIVRARLRCRVPLLRDPDCRAGRHSAVRHCRCRRRRLSSARLGSARHSTATRSRRIPCFPSKISGRQPCRCSPPVCFKQSLQNELLTYHQSKK